MRLFRLVRMRARLERSGSRGDVRRRFVELAITSTLQDCEGLGLRGEAHALLESDERTVDS